MAWRIILFFLGLCGVETVFGQTDSVAVRLQQVKLAENDSVRLKYADEISGYLEKIPYGQYAQLPAVQFLGYRKCVNDDAELFPGQFLCSRDKCFTIGSGLRKVTGLII